ncbi:MAG: hypothetical protein NT167_26670, partial [Verrucomicrobia bacterium]|nr:hypothetical protein [Verrucomicrobiota bacterium]
EMVKLTVSAITLGFIASLCEQVCPSTVWGIAANVLQWLLLLFFSRRITLRIRWISNVKCEAS